MYQYTRAFGCVGTVPGAACGSVLCNGDSGLQPMQNGTVTSPAGPSTVTNPAVGEGGKPTGGNTLKTAIGVAKGTVYSRVVPRLELQLNACGTAGWCVLK